MRRDARRSTVQIQPNWGTGLLLTVRNTAIFFQKPVIINDLIGSSITFQSRNNGRVSENVDYLSFQSVKRKNPHLSDQNFKGACLKLAHYKILKSVHSLLNHAYFGAQITPPGGTPALKTRKY